MGAFIDLTGREQNSIIVLQSLKEVNVSGSRMWLCKCKACGKLFKVSTSSINQNLKSCGCIQRKKFVESNTGKPSNNIKPKGHSASRKLYMGYKCAAKKRGLSFNIDFDTFLRITKMNCHYCNAAPSNVSRILYVPTNGEYVYNGLDRIDNSLGYELGNVVPSCSMCNKRKDKRSVDEFLNWVKSVYEHSIKKC